MNVGTKLVSVSKWNEYKITVDFIKTINEKSYSLERGSKINKETMTNKWKEVYSIPTQEQLEFIDKNHKKKVLTEITDNFNSAVRDTINILETVEKYNHLLEFDADVIDELGYCISNLREELEER